MINVRRHADRGHFNHGWLDTYHTFSFADYYNPAHMGFKSLRVINEDRVAPGQGFGMHGHRDMEIMTYVLDGELEHRDSLGNGEIIRPGEVQYMAAGTGVRHSEFNPSPAKPVHLMQIWIRPQTNGAPPRYEKRLFPALSENGKLHLLASPDGEDNSIAINQDARVLAARLQPGQSVRYAVGGARAVWVQVLRGEITLNGERLSAGDGASISDESTMSVNAESAADLLLFDLV